jgi:small subunit ribosomal protein S4
MLERQFRKNFEMAKKIRGNTGDTIIQLLERRLDNTLYRMALSPTRASARQFIGHGHVQVNGKKLSIPSYLVKIGDVINLTAKGAEIPAVKKMLEDKTPTVPMWIERKGPAGKIVRLSERTDVTEDINEQLIIEFYSR